LKNNQNTYNPLFIYTREMGKNSLKQVFRYLFVGRGFYFSIPFTFGNFETLFVVMKVDLSRFSLQV